ncbi:hypothetical protein QT987_04865 [Microcoleus sp. SVA1B4]
MPVPQRLNFLVEQASCLFLIPWLAEQATIKNETGIHKLSGK